MEELLGQGFSPQVGAGDGAELQSSTVQYSQDVQ